MESLIGRLFSRHKKNSAQIARDRLLHLTFSAPKYPFIEQMRKELIEVIMKYTGIEADDVDVNLTKQDGNEIFVISANLPISDNTRSIKSTK